MIWIFVIATTVALTNCELEKAALDVADSNNEFGFNIYKYLSKTESGNVVFSPYSAEIVLALIYGGARGHTAEQMAGVLSLPDQSTTAKGFKALQTIQSNLDSNTVDDNVFFQMANKVYKHSGNGFKVHDTFLKLARESYNTEVESINFDENSKSAAKINEWVEMHTDSKIRDLVKADDLGKDTRLVLVNAAYFLGNWKYPFHASHKPLRFHHANGETKDVDAMQLHTRYFYKENADLDANILKIPYNNSDYSLVVVLPNKVDGLQKIEAKLPLKMDELVKDMAFMSVVVVLPKFRIETELNLNKCLLNLGMTDLFSTPANLTGISTEPLYVSKVAQKAFIDVNEKGTQAGVASAVNVITRIIPLEFVADRPFFMILYQESTNLALFMARYNQV